MDIIDEIKYNEFKHILLGCRNVTDASYFADAYIKKNPETKKLIIGMLNGKKYSSCKDFRLMQKIMKECNTCEYYEDAINIIKEYFPSKDTNNIQYRTLLRIAETKKRLNINENQSKASLIRKNKIGLITKNCPHCERSYIGNNDTTYVICGYQDTQHGYDWKGCTKDWCFSCEKMLCKSWDDNKLFVEPNRIHNGECCKRHAQIHKKMYTEDYCQCDNKYVIRGKN
jgi:hypothetical protein